VKRGFPLLLCRYGEVDLQVDVWMRSLSLSPWR
jgi:hypothetical protein